MRTSLGDQLDQIPLFLWIAAVAGRMLGMW